jgi:hypothetical protein
MKIYLDGQLSDTGTFAYDTGATVPNGSFTVGARSYGSTVDQYFGGKIDDVRIYGHALSTGEIQQLYGQQLPAPIAHWKLDEGSGVVAYDSVGMNHGIVYGPNWTTGVLDGALDFNGVDDYVQANDDPSLRFDQYSSFAISYWANPVSEDLQSHTVVAKMRGAEQVGQFSYEAKWNGSDSGFRFVAGKSFVGSTAVVSEAVSTGSWYHVVGVYDNNDMKIYLNGNFSDGATFGFDTGSTAPDGNPVIGARQYNSTTEEYFEGKIDDVRIYDQALSEGEVLLLYQNVVGGPNEPNEPNEPVEPSRIYYVDGISGSDLYDGLTFGTAFATIQKGIDTAYDGNTVLVYPAVYSEAIDMSGKAISVQGVATAAGVAVIEAPGDFAVTCYSGEDSNTVLEHFVIRNSEMAVFLADASPTLRYLTIVDNDFGIAAYGNSEPDISNCIFWNNTDGHVYSCLARWVCVLDPNDPNVSPVGLAAHWKLDETSGTVADDSSGNGHIGNLKGGLSFDNDSIPGPVGDALDFDGTNDYIKAPTAVAPTSTLTMAMWIRPNSELNAASGRMELLHWSDPIQRPHLTFNMDGDGKIKLHVKIDGQGYNDVQTMTAVWQASTWYHIAVTFNGIDFKVYVDGDPENTVTHPGTHAWTSELYIGSHRMGAYYWDGAMDDVRMYSRALTAEEIQQLYLDEGGANPQFADAPDGDYHLKSERGRYWPQYNVWVLDDVTSPCVDLGDPMLDPSNEPMPNGGRLNVGVYGNTPYASMSEWPIPEDHNRDGIVNWLDAASLAAKWLEMLDWYE